MCKLLKVLVFLAVVVTSQAKASYTANQLTQSLVTWVDFCNTEKQKLSEYPVVLDVFKEFEFANQQSAINFNGKILFEEYQMPVLVNDQMIIEKINSFDSGGYSVLVQGNDNRFEFVKSPQENKNYLWKDLDQVSETDDTEIKLQEYLNNKFYPQGWDYISMIMEEYSSTPEDIKCDFDRSVDDMKKLYILGLKRIEGLPNYIKKKDFYDLRGLGAEGFLMRELILFDGKDVNVVTLMFNYKGYKYQVYYTFYESMLESFRDVIASIYKGGLLSDKQNNNSDFDTVVKQFDQLYKRKQ